MVPMAVVDVGLAHLHTVIHRVPDELCWRVKAHRLRVQDGSAEDVRVMAFEPSRYVNEKGERGGMAFGETVIAETLDLLEAALSEFGRVTPGGHPVP